MSSDNREPEDRFHIALAGAHGTGKTTLAKAFSGRFELVELPTPGRLMAAQGLPVNQSATVVSQCLAWFLQVSLEEETRRWVSMRSLVDIWAYCALASERAPLTALEAELFAQLTGATRALVQGRYDVLFYLPPRIPLVPDEVRSRTIQCSKLRSTSRSDDYIDAWNLDYVEIDVSRRDAVEMATQHVARAAAARRP